MIQNLKVDIIYHSTPSDFEMEFNLCGCCRMRLLSDKTADKKGFIKALARDVDRSRVIICCGPLFNTDGIINTVASAIGSGLDVCDNKLYGINGNDEIKIIRGSTPLVTPDGYFGGCIIESGPQTIILLTENKAFRKAIMQTLIHPYIEEICYIPTNPAAIVPNAQPQFETAVTENEEYIVSTEDAAEDADATEPAPETEAEYITAADEPEQELNDTDNTALPIDEHNIQFVMDDDTHDYDAQPEAEPSPVLDDSYKLMYTEVETKEEIKSRYEDPYKPSKSDNMFLTSAEDETAQPEVKPATSKSINITIVVLVLLLLLALLAIVYFVVLEPVSSGVNIKENAKQIFGIASQSSLV